MDDSKYVVCNSIRLSSMPYNIVRPSVLKSLLIDIVRIQVESGPGPVHLTNISVSSPDDAKEMQDPVPLEAQAPSQRVSDEKKEKFTALPTKRTLRSTTNSQSDFRPSTSKSTVLPSLPTTSPKSRKRKNAVDILDPNPYASSSAIQHKKIKRSPSDKAHQLVSSKDDHSTSIALLNHLSQLSLYHKALLLKKNQKRELLELDIQLSESSVSDWLPKTRLENVLQWKLLRGKFRPTLPALVKSNSDESVAKVVNEALKKLKGCNNVDEALVSGAIETMCQLKGIGPATASAFLSFEEPTLVPFMSDEAAEYLKSSLGPVKYTLPFFKKFMKAMDTKVGELDQMDIGSHQWDVRRAERTFWTLSVLKTCLKPSEWEALVDSCQFVT
ncbi:hypothetical protein CROQUDRAFT_108296 [Cronartium quercuum f. sp. fusiforme G11]|uniref:Uncharacterized protein n=1 Tax=Cronartium quercuum f. sp. fusiforme G11 TaxID=708437 RepID=A0A9P6TA29_9BASI|nr:hypothetical protein CROQUDRAFT_108296 [Cronartium quercuum f. sp. fusiforme G11]